MSNEWWTEFFCRCYDVPEESEDESMPQNAHTTTG